MWLKVGLLNYSLVTVFSTRIPTAHQKLTQSTLFIDIANVAVLFREEPSVLKGVKLASVLAVASLALAACGSSGETATSAAPTEPAAVAAVKVGMAYDQDGKGDGWVVVST